LCFSRATPQEGVLNGRSSRKLATAPDLNPGEAKALESSTLSPSAKDMSYQDLKKELGFVDLIAEIRFLNQFLEDKRLWNDYMDYDDSIADDPRRPLSAEECVNLFYRFFDWFSVQFPSEENPWDELEEYARLAVANGKK
jgi:hypothetical protein